MCLMIAAALVVACADKPAIRYPPDEPPLEPEDPLGEVIRNGGSFFMVGYPPEETDGSPIDEFAGEFEPPHELYSEEPPPYPIEDDHWPCEEYRVLDDRMVSIDGHLQNGLHAQYNSAGPADRSVFAFLPSTSTCAVVYAFIEVRRDRAVAMLGHDKEYFFFTKEACERAVRKGHRPARRDCGAYSGSSSAF